MIEEMHSNSLFSDKTGGFIHPPYLVLRTFLLFSQSTNPIKHPVLLFWLSFKKWVQV